MSAVPNASGDAGPATGRTHPNANPWADLRARKQTREDAPHTSTTSTNGSSRPQLRVVGDPAQTGRPAQQPAPETTPVGGHVGDLKAAVGAHTVTGQHPPTVIDAAADLWLDRDDVRHGLAGQLAAAAAGLIQLAGLAICWAAAHGLFATKTRAAVTALALAAAALAYTLAAHT